MTNYVVEGELVTAVQESALVDALIGTLSFGFSVTRGSLPMSVPEAIGTRVGLKPVPPSLRTGQRHKIENVIVALESLIRSREKR